MAGEPVVQARRGQHPTLECAQNSAFAFQPIQDWIMKFMQKLSFFPSLSTVGSWGFPSGSQGAFTLQGVTSAWDVCCCLRIAEERREGFSVTLSLLDFLPLGHGLWAHLWSQPKSLTFLLTSQHLPSALKFWAAAILLGIGHWGLLVL